MRKNRTFGFKGKYCTLCNSVWEIVSSQGSVGVEVRYPDFPSFGLERQDCTECVATNPVDPTSTLSD